MKIFAVYNIKGGVGKTTTSVNLAYLSAAQGTRTLIWDVDPQGGSSYYLCVKPKIKGGVKELLNKKPSLDTMLRMTGYSNLDLLPSDLSYRRMDEFLQAKGDPRKALMRLVKPLSKKYDTLFLDCPPGLSQVTESIFEIADGLIVPLIPTPLSLRAYNRLVRFLINKRSRKLVVMPFFNHVNLDKPIHRVVTKNVQKKHSIFLKGSIPESSIIEAMGVKRAPLFTYARESSESDDYKILWSQIKDRC
ncbi:MAG: ParA family protein [Magnetococcales bacterium]|nr:ParA family protein [Magnetococcales bacterium]